MTFVKGLWKDLLTGVRCTCTEKGYMNLPKPPLVPAHLDRRGVEPQKSNKDRKPVRTELCKLIRLVGGTYDAKVRQLFRACLY